MEIKRHFTTAEYEDEFIIDLLLYVSQNIIKYYQLLHKPNKFVKFCLCLY